MNENGNRGNRIVVVVLTVFFIIFPIFFAVNWVAISLSAGAPLIFTLIGVVVPGIMVFSISRVLLAIFKKGGKNRDVYDFENLPDEPDPWDEDFEQKIDEYRLAECGHIHNVNDAEHLYDDAETNFCPYCGTKVENNHQFCKNCGREL